MLLTLVEALMATASCCEGHVNSLYGRNNACDWLRVSNRDEYRKDKEITYEEGCVGDQAGEPLALKVAVVKLEPRRASMASA